jgi:dihydrofolate synthase/folylpolyglutamate synthase
MPNAISTGLQTVQWPARLQRLSNGALSKQVPPGWELWLDGGHNDSAGLALARQAKTWRAQDAKALYLVCGMLSSKDPRAFLAPLAPYAAGLLAVAIPNETSYAAEDLSAAAREAGIENAEASLGLVESLKAIVAASSAPGRILICGSLYLAGRVLKEEAFSI